MGPLLVILPRRPEHYVVTVDLNRDMTRKDPTKRTVILETEERETEK
jgi:hypothetical protein